MKRYIVIHHSLTTDSGTVSWGAIEKYHREHNGWRDIGYHYGVELVGDSFYALVGRPEDDDAAAVKEEHMNQRGIHICCVGNYDLEPPSEVMLDVLVNRLVVPLRSRHMIPVGNIVCHRDYAPYKSCPGSMFDIKRVRDKVIALL